MSLNIYSQGALNKVCGNFIVDSTLSATSGNAISNSAVASKFEDIEQEIELGGGKFYATEAEAIADLANIENGQLVYTNDGDDSITASEISFDDKMSGSNVQTALGATMNGTFVNSNTGDFDNYNEPGNYVIYPSSGNLSQWSHYPITTPGMLFVMCAARSSSTGASAYCTQIYITWEGSMMYVRTRWGNVWQNSGNWRRFQFVSS